MIFNFRVPRSLGEKRAFEILKCFFLWIPVLVGVCGVDSHGCPFVLQPRRSKGSVKQVIDDTVNGYHPFLSGNTGYQLEKRTWISS